MMLLVIQNIQHMLTQQPQITMKEEDSEEIVPAIEAEECPALYFLLSIIVSIQYNQ